MSRAGADRHPQQHHHAMGTIRVRDGHTTFAPLPGSIEHAHAWPPRSTGAPALHHHQGCPHSPAHARLACPAPCGSVPGEPPLGMSSATLPKPHQITPSDLAAVRVWDERLRRN